LLENRSTISWKIFMAPAMSPSASFLKTAASYSSSADCWALAARIRPIETANKKTPNKLLEILTLFIEFLLPFYFQEDNNVFFPLCGYD